MAGHDEWIIPFKPKMLWLYRCPPHEQLYGKFLFCPFCRQRCRRFKRQPIARVSLVTRENKTR